MRWVVLTLGTLAVLIAVLILRAPPASDAPPAAAIASKPLAPPVLQSPMAAPKVARAPEPEPDAAVATPVDTTRASESELMASARALLTRDAQQTLQLLEVADQRFGADREERRVLEIEALVQLERIGQSHAKAEHFYRRFPDSAQKIRIEQLTGYHPRPWGPSE